MISNFKPKHRISFLIIAIALMLLFSTSAFAADIVNRISKTVVSYQKNFVFTGDAITPEITVKDSKGNVLIKDRDYLVSFEKNVNRGSASIIINGIGNYEGCVIKKFRINPVKMTMDNVFIKMGEVTSSSGDKALSPQLEIKYNDKLLSEGQDFVVKYKKRSKKEIENGLRGPRIIINGRGNFKGSFEYIYEIPASDIYVSPTGNDMATGDIGHPYKTIQRALYAALPGYTVFLREGKYIGCNIIVDSGNAEDGFITVTSYPGEMATVTTKKSKSGAAFYCNGNSYIKISNLHIADMKAKDVYGILMTGGENNIYIDNCEFSNIVTSKPGSATRSGGSSNAILLLGEGISADESIRNVYITDNKIHDNVNGWSENISIAGNCEYIFVNNNQVYDNTNIGIDFYGNAEYCKEKSLDQPRFCECVGNMVSNNKSFYAENAGIYVDGAHDIIVQGNSVTNNFYGIEVGSEEWRSDYDENNQVRSITIKDNQIYDNSDCGLRLGGWTNDDSTGVVRDCIITGNTFTNNSSSNSEIILAKCNNIRFSANTFGNGLSYNELLVYDEAIDRGKITNIYFE